jgi:hypothetical protein
LPSTAWRKPLKCGEYTLNLVSRKTAFRCSGQGGNAQNKQLQKNSRGG